MNKNVSEIKRANTSIKILPDVWKKARIAAIEEDITTSQLLEQAVLEYIKNKKVKK